jgi:hypothetical protein
MRTQTGACSASLHHDGGHGWYQPAGEGAQHRAQNAEGQARRGEAPHTAVARELREQDEPAGAAVYGAAVMHPADVP